MKMIKELVNDAAPTSEVKAANLETLLADYKEPLTVAPSAVPSAVPSAAPSSGSQVLNDTIKYYKTGKKAGQPKPNRTAVLNSPPTQQQPLQPNVGNSNPTGQLNSELISGALFITVVDLLLPMAIAFVNNRYSKKKIKAEKMMLTEKQKKDLEPLATQVINQLQIQANPVLLLVVSMGGMYAMNFVLQKSSSGLNPASV